MLGTGRVWVVVKSVVSYPVCPANLLFFSPLTAAPFQYLRVTLNWATIAFFVFSFLHCFTQGTIQSFLFSADDSYGALTSEIVARANITSTIFPQYTGRHGKYSLELCDQVPVLGGEPHPCDPFFTVGQPGPIVIPSRALPSGFKNVSSVRQLFLETFDFCLTLFLSCSPPASSDRVRPTWWVSTQASFSPPLIFLQTSPLWIVSGRDFSRSLQIDSQPRPDGLTNVVVTSTDGTMSITLEPACTFTLLYPQAK